MPGQPQPDDRGLGPAAVDRFEGPLTLYAARLLGDAEAARDVVQETFLRLCAQDRAAIEPRLAEWLFTVCRNRALDVLRKESRMTRLSEEQVHRCLSPDPGPHDVAERRDWRRGCSTCSTASPTNQREVIRLKFQNGFSYQEISRISGHSVSNVGYLIHAGMKTLRGRLFDGQPVEAEPDVKETRPMTFDPNDPRLTAYALGELDDGGDRRRRGPARRVRREPDNTSRTFARRPGSSPKQFQKEPTPGLTTQHRAAIEEELRPAETRQGSHRPARRRALRCALASLAAAAGILGVTATLLLPRAQRVSVEIGPGRSSTTPRPRGGRSPPSPTYKSPEEPAVKAASRPEVDFAKRTTDFDSAVSPLPAKPARRAPLPFPFPSLPLPPLRLRLPWRAG